MKNFLKRAMLGEGVQDRSTTTISTTSTTTIT